MCFNKLIRRQRQPTKTICKSSNSQLKPRNEITTRTEIRRLPYPLDILLHFNNNVATSTIECSTFFFSFALFSFLDWQHYVIDKKSCFQHSSVIQIFDLVSIRFVVVLFVLILLLLHLLLDLISISFLFTFVFLIINSAWPQEFLQARQADKRKQPLHK